MIVAILATLQADATLAALLPGGLFNADTVTVVSKERTPDAFDANGELRPCALLQANRLTPEPGFRSVETLSLTVYAYQRSGTASIEPARLRIRSLLDRRRIAGVGEQTWEVQYAEDVLSLRDLGLRANLIVSRYTVPLIAA